MIIKTIAYPRAALVGNPSDGYYGKTIAFVFKNYSAQAQLYESPELDLLPSLRDHSTFNSIDDLCKSVSSYGYYGGIRLLKAAIFRFHDYCAQHGITLDSRNFTLRYQTDIPNRLGLAGSSAIITAVVRALCQFYQVPLAPENLANFVLSVEREELGIPAGLQDRVAQAYNYPIYMDFEKKHMMQYGIGKYAYIDIPEDLHCYIAFRTDLAEGSEILHSHLKEEYDAGVVSVHKAMHEWACLTDKVRLALQSKKYDSISALLNRNFDLRCEVCGNTVSQKNRAMVTLARSVGASAKLTGSGGAIIGIYQDDTMFEKLQVVLGEHGIKVIKPMIVREKIKEPKAKG